MLPRVLVAAGDYKINHAVTEALKEMNVNVRGAYSHRDTLYMLQQQRFSLIVLDAAMFDRYSDEFTISALERLKNPVPRIAVALDSRGERRSRDLASMILTTLEPDEVRRTTASILGTRVANRDQATRNLMNNRRMEEINTLFRVSKLLTEVLDLSEVLNRVVEAARELTNAEESLLLMPGITRKGEEALLLRASSGIELGEDEDFRARFDTSVVGDVFRTGQPLMEDSRSGRHKLNTQHLVNAILYVPISSHGRTIGVLGVSNRAKRDIFDIMHQELLLNLSAYAAIAIENARIHEESVQRTRELEMLVNASQVMNGSLRMDDTFINICEQINVVTNASKVTIYHIDDEDNLSRRAQYASSIWRPLQGTFHQVTQSYLRLLLDNGSSWEAEDMHHALSVPLMSDGRFFGLVKLCYLIRPPGDPLRERAAQVNTEALASLADLLNTASDPRKTRAEVIRRMNTINSAVGSDWCEIWLASDRTAAGLYLMAEVGKAAWQTPPYKIISPAQNTAIARAMETREVVSETRPSPRLVVPVALAERVMGLILVTDTDPERQFTHREIEMTKALAGQAATALENARLHLDLAQNLAELKTTQGRLAETVRYTAMGELAAIVAHQINNPLTTIIVDSELLLLDEPKDTRRHKQLTAIHSAGKRASEVAKRLLAMVRPSDPDAERELIDVVETVNGVLALVGTHVERRNIQLRTRLPKADAKPYPPVLAIKGQLDDIWFNLITNAYEAMSNQASGQLGVEISHNVPKKQIVVRIWDTGPGMTEEIRQRIFDPFFTTKSHGTGLGLHICRQVLEDLNGSIEVESVPGKGTRFTVSLPVVTELELAKDDF